MFVISQRVSRPLNTVKQERNSWEFHSPFEAITRHESDEVTELDAGSYVSDDMSQFTKK